MHQFVRDAQAAERGKRSTAPPTTDTPGATAAPPHAAPPQKEKTHAPLQDVRILDFTEAATLPCATVTAWSALEGVGPGDTVLVQGSGGVSLFALRLARAAGARVIATTSSEKKAERLRELGASDVITYVDTPDWGAEVRKFTDGHGADVIVEIGGAGTPAQSIKAVAYRGVISQVGHVSLFGDVPPETTGVNLLEFTASGATLRTIGGGSRSDLENMNRVISAHKLHPVIDRVFPFEEALDAASHLVSCAHFGKVVITH
ncbi:zinc-dependent alcohol dehydrogenase family protein [Streptomyces botrytidirepellens]|nr:NAD(P)-dependent alcohol dehydrogenase [Streptomyces botrytidirepellens]